MFKLSQTQKDILKLLPQKAAKLVPFTELIKMGSKVATTAVGGESYKQDLAQLTEAALPEGVVVVPSEEGLNPSLPLLAPHGEKVLEIYFTQLFRQDASVHLDLRANYFSAQSETLLWRPSPLRYKFSAAFLISIRELYQGFYDDKPDVFDKGLEGLGMIRSSMSPEERQEIRQLLFSHFGEGRTSPVVFSVSKFQKSFDEIFSYFLKNEVPLHPEFALLGANLATLYANLQNIKAPLDVRSAFMKADSNLAR
jgi:hypothetical protein